VLAAIGGPAEGEEREAVLRPRPPRWYPRRSPWATPASFALAGPTDCHQPSESRLLPL